MMTRTALRTAAKKAGEKFFEDPKGCKHGHNVFYTSNGSCVMCAQPVTFTLRTHPDDAGRVTEAQQRCARTPTQISQATGLSVEYIVRLLGGSADLVAWSDAQVNTLRQLYHRKPSREIAKILGRTPKAVRSKALKLGIVRPEAPGPTPDLTGHTAHNPFAGRLS